MKTKQLLGVLGAAAAVMPASAYAHTDMAPAAAQKFVGSRVEDTPFGRQGEPKKVTRTIRVGMYDRMRFDPESISVKKGETIRFVVANKGAVLHEMVLGTRQALNEHHATMKKHPGMEHDAPGMTHVKPGATGEIVWQFTKAGDFRFACLVPGHFEAGMVGKVSVQ